jgi:hypothetical protein
MGKFECKMDKNGTSYSVILSGVIDEDADFAPHSLAGASEVVVNCDGIKSINSCGIREWINWISTAKGAVVYDRCPKIIVDQVNMVQGFLPLSGKVSSFYVPYYSEESNEEKVVLFREGQEFTAEGDLQPPSVTDSKGSEMEMDVIEAKYFKFLKK